MAPLLRESTSPPPARRPSPMNIQLSCTALAPPPLKAGGAKICPLNAKNSLPKNAYVMPKDKKMSLAAVPPTSKGQGAAKATTGCTAGGGAASAPGGSGKPHTTASSRSFPLFSSGSGSSSGGNGSNHSKLIAIDGAGMAQKLIRFRSTILQRKRPTTRRTNPWSARRRRRNSR